MSKQKIKQIYQSNYQQLEQSKQNQKMIVASQFLDQYQKYIGKLNSNNQHRIKLQKNNILNWSNQFKINLSSQIIQTDFQTSKIKIHYGNFITHINIIMTNLGNQFYSDKLISQGSYGFVYSIKYKNQDYALKSIKLNQIEKKYKNLNNIYKEYLLSLIASCLQIGPKIHQLFGYDIVITKNQAMFVMEYCQNQLSIQPYITQKIFKQNLRIMHQIQMVHLDLKLQNIAYSKRLKRYVFIDYGLSLLIKQQIGTKTFTNFIGTLNYCSQQMRKICYLKQPLFIDLYYNDMHSLKKALSYLKNQTAINSNYQIKYGDKSLDAQAQQNSIFSNKLLEGVDMYSQSLPIFQMKLHIFTKNIYQIIRIWSSHYQTSLLFTIFVLTYEICQQFKEIKQIKVLFDKLKNDISSKMFSITKTDEILSNYFQSAKDKEKRFKLISLHSILTLHKTLLYQKLQDVTWVYYLFVYFSPLSKFHQEQAILSWQKNNKAKFIIQKMCDALNYNSTVPILYMKSRFILLFFYQHLLPLQNLQILFQIRLLFITIQDYGNVERIQQEIIYILSKDNKNNLIFFLKIAEFYLFWYKLFEYGFHKETKWINLIQQKAIQPNNYLQAQVKQLILQLLKQLLDRSYKNDLFELQAVRIQTKIQIIQKLQILETNQKCKQIIGNIKYHYKGLYKEKIACLHQRMVFAIYNKNSYHQFTPSQSQKRLKIQQACFLSFQNIFVTLWQYSGYQDMSEVVKIAVDCIIEVYSGKAILIIENILVKIASLFTSYKKYTPSLNYLIKKMLQSQLSSIQNFRKSKITQFQVSKYLLYIVYLLQCIRYGTQNEENEAIKQQARQLATHIMIFFTKIKTLTTNKQLQRNFEVTNMIFENHINVICKDTKVQIIVEKVNQIYLNFQKQIHSKYKVYYIFFQHLRTIYQIFHLIQNNCFQSMIIKLGLYDSNAQLNWTFLRNYELIRRFIIISCRQDQYQIAYNFFLSFLNRFDGNKKIAVLIIKVIELFIKLCPDKILVRLCLQNLHLLQFNQSKLVIYTKFYAQFVIFCRIIDYVDLNIKMKHIVKMSMALPNLQIQFSLRVKPIIFKICRKMRLYKSQKQLLRWIKIEITSVFEDKLDIYIKFVETKIKKINNKRVELILKKAQYIKLKKYTEIIVT